MKRSENSPSTWPTQANRITSEIMARKSILLVSQHQHQPLLTKGTFKELTDHKDCLGHWTVGIGSDWIVPPFSCALTQLFATLEHKLSRNKRSPIRHYAFTHYDHCCTRISHFVWPRGFQISYFVFFQDFPVDALNCHRVIGGSHC